MHVGNSISPQPGQCTDYANRVQVCTFVLTSLCPEVSITYPNAFYNVVYSAPSGRSEKCCLMASDAALWQVMLSYGK